MSNKRNLTIYLLIYKRVKRTFLLKRLLNKRVKLEQLSTNGTMASARRHTSCSIGSANGYAWLHAR